MKASVGNREKKLGNRSCIVILKLPCEMVVKVCQNDEISLLIEQVSSIEL